MVCGGFSFIGVESGCSLSDKGLVGMCVVDCWLRGALVMTTKMMTKMMTMNMVTTIITIMMITMMMTMKIYHDHDSVGLMCEGGCWLLMIEA